MTWYTFFKSIHVITAVIWVGGATIIQAYAFRILRGADGRRQAEFAKDTEIVSTRVFIPSSLVLLIAAIGMMMNADLDWGQNWIVFALISFALSVTLGVAFLSPEAGRLATLLEQEGADSPQVQARIRRILAFSRAELVVLIAVVWNMVVKPVGSPGWFWGALVVMAVAIVAVIAGYLRGESAIAATAST